MMTATESTRDVLDDSKERTLQKHVETRKSGTVSGNNAYDETMHHEMEPTHYCYK